MQWRWKVVFIIVIVAMSVHSGGGGGGGVSGSVVEQASWLGEVVRRQGLDCELAFKNLNVL